MASGELRRADPALAAQVIMGTVMDFVLRRQVLRDPVMLRYTHEQIVEGVIDIATHGLLPR